MRCVGVKQLMDWWHCVDVTAVTSVAANGTYKEHINFNSFTAEQQNVKTPSTRTPDTQHWICWRVQWELDCVMFLLSYENHFKSKVSNSKFPPENDKVVASVWIATASAIRQRSCRKNKQFSLAESEFMSLIAIISPFFCQNLSPKNLARKSFKICEEMDR